MTETGIDTISQNRPSGPKALGARTPLPRFRRASEAPACIVQPRDAALLEDLWHYRCLTTSQLEILRASDSDPALRFVSRLTLTRRLKLLFHGKYVSRLARPTTGGMQEPVYLLDSAGARFLSRLHGEVPVRTNSRFPKLVALEHALAINQFRVSLVASCARTANTPSEARLLQWQSGEAAKFSVSLSHGDPRTAETKSSETRGRAMERKVILILDGFFVFKPPSLRLFYFLEVDLGSEASRVLVDKCRAYYAFWQSGGFGEKHALEGKVGFRVLFVAPTEKRAATILKAFDKLDAGKAMFWVALQDQITPLDLLRPLWKNALHPDRRYNLLGHAAMLSR
jgi:hypothetical protein